MVSGEVIEERPRIVGQGNVVRFTEVKNWKVSEDVITEWLSIHKEAPGHRSSSFAERAGFYAARHYVLRVREFAHGLARITAAPLPCFDDLRRLVFAYRRRWPYGTFLLQQPPRLRRTAKLSIGSLRISASRHQGHYCRTRDGSGSDGHAV